MANSDHQLTAATPLLESEIHFAEALVAEAGWNQTARDWQAFLDLGKVFAIRDNQRRVVATAATLPFGGQFAWISMVLVTKEYQRKGLATQLLRRCIDDIQAAGLVPVLDATPTGREVYRGLGFQDSWGFQRYMRRKTPAPQAKKAVPAGVTLHAITNAVWPALCAYDADIFGADRSQLLTRLRRRAPSIEKYAERNGKIAGLLLGRDGRVATQIGPLIADDENIARALLAQAVDAIPDQIFIDVVDSKPAAVADLVACDFLPQRTLTRMLLSRSKTFDDGLRTYAVIGPEFG
jgi:GNAT superfamily N-acetyltransferase